MTIESCLNSKCKTEIIVIDDGSTDGTLEWLKKRHDIIFLKQQQLGKCWAVNSGFKIARGKYIRFLDSDDLIEPYANDEQFDLAESTLADIVVSGLQNFDNEGRVFNKTLWVETDDFIARQLGEGNSSHYSAYLFRKEFIEETPHRPDFAYRDDRLFILEVALKNPKITIHSKIALLHRIHFNNRLQSSSGLKQQVQNFQHLNIYKRILNQLMLEGRLTTRRINSAINVLWPLAHWIAKSEINEAEQLVNWIYELNPTFAIPEKGFLGLCYRNLGFKTTEKFLKLRRNLLLK